MNTNLGKKSTETSGWKSEQKKNDVETMEFYFLCSHCPMMLPEKMMSIDFQGHFRNTFISLNINCNLVSALTQRRMRQTL